MSDPVQRMNYFDHQFLHVEDFQTEQAYHIGARERHNRYLHTPGVAYGLRVAPGGAGSTAVSIGEGMALDADGNEIVITDTQTLELGTFDADKSVWVVISYASYTGRETNETGVAGDTRVIEQPLIQALDQVSIPSGSGRIVLARVARTGTTVASVDETPRTLAGSMEGDVQLTPQNPAVPQTQWVSLGWTAANRADLVGTLSIRKPPSASSEGNLAVDGNVAVGGDAEIAGATSLAGTLAVGGQISASGLVGLGVTDPMAQLDVAGPGFFRSAPWAGSAPLAAAAGSDGLITGFDPGAGTGFLQALTATGTSTRLWLDGDPIIFGPRSVERGRLDFTGNLTLAGGLVIDSGNTNAGASIPTAALGPYLTFGTSNSGEGLGSRRGPGGNQFGLDLFTNYLPRLSVTNGGLVGIGTQTPQAQLHVGGTGEIRWGNSLLSSNQGGSIELGAFGSVAGAANQVPYIDFHYGNVAQDYNVRLINDADQRLSALASTFRQNFLSLSGGLGWSSIAYNAYHLPSGAWGFLDSSHGAMTVEMDDAGGVPRFQVWSSPAGGAAPAFQMRLAIEGVNGHVGIGTAPQPGYLLWLNGNAIGVSWSSTSDRALKKNVRALGDVLDQVRSLDGVRYEWKKTAMRSAGFPSDDPNIEGPQIGLVAQQVEQHFPELVTSWEAPDGKTYRGLDYMRITAVLVEAIKELADRVDALEERAEGSTSS